MISLFSFVALAASASLTFGPTPETVPVGDEFKVAINVQSGGRETIGADAVVLFDPKILAVTKVKEGKAYPLYPPNLIDIDNVHGKVSFSGTVGFQAPKVVDGLLGEITFRAKKPGATQIDFAWQAKAVNDSNIVPSADGLDLLSEAPSSVILSFREATREEKILSLIKRIFSFDYLRF